MVIRGNWARSTLNLSVGLPGGSAGKGSACNAGDLGSIPGLGRSPGGGKGYSLQYSRLENSVDCMVHGVAKSLTRLSNVHNLCTNFATPQNLQLFHNLVCFQVMGLFIQFSSVWSLSRVQLFATLWTATCQASLSITNPRTCSNSGPSSW